jgi:signal transduction histidine kinase/ActR/RegA family two-component response regulator
MSTGSIFSTLAPASPDHAGRVSSSHFVQLYEDDNFLVDIVARQIGDGLEAGDGAIVIASRTHRAAIGKRLRARGLDLDTMAEQRRFLSLDADETLTKLLVDDYPDAVRFETVIGGAIADANAASPRHYVRAFGEMVALLWADGKRDAALRLEALWNDLANRYRFSLLCGYPLNSFSGALDEQYLARVCAEHSEVIPAESYSGLAVPEDRQRTIVHLQQKAMRLESEMAVRKLVENELRNKISELAEADRRKNEFLAMLGHELRNPLSAVLNAITAADLDQSRRDRAIDIARRQTAQLARLVDDLLDVARITQGRIALRKEPVSVMSIVERSIEETRAATEARQQRMIVIAPPETRTIHVEVDPARMQQCIGNLLQNASKFTPARGRIEVSVLRNGSDVAIRVRDTGIGIAPEMLARVFDLFAQGDVAMDRAQGGLGIGLTLVKQLVAMHGGGVQARSEGLGKGSEFVISLPILHDGVKNVSLENTVPVQGSSRVLIVEDNGDAAESLRMLLELLGHQVRVAQDGFVALDILSEETFDVILVDIGLPGMDGYALANQIRALPESKVMRLVALTGYGQDEDRRRALSAGFDQHLVKPIDLDRLQALLADLTPTALTS